jgi:hypothetical protein
VIGGSNVDNLIQFIMMSLMEYGGLTFDEIGSKLVCFGSDGVTMFKGLQISVATQLKSKATSFVIVVHYMGCWTNFTVLTIYVQPLVGKLEALLQKWGVIH